jgi:predicted RNase H-like nuclease (RuvC/YqgF family)
MRRMKSAAAIQRESLAAMMAAYKTMKDQLERIERELTAIAEEDLTTAEKNILRIIKEQK